MKLSNIPCTADSDPGKQRNTPIVLDIKDGSHPLQPDMISINLGVL